MERGLLMPYIKPEDRSELAAFSDDLSDLIRSVGELNYVITRICHNWIEKTGKRYTHLNQVMGVLECAKLEFYRMVVSQYENQKILENGKVSEVD